MESIEKQQQLDTLKADILSSATAPGLAAQATQLVMGSGNPNADIVLIGEAPGKKEDETGLPFQGAAGKRLDELFATAGLNRNDVYITNIVKYRPPENRDPKESEKQEFWPYLERELKIVNPKIIMTLGRHSMSHFLPAAVIGDVHGTIHDVTVAGESYRVAPLYHPAAAIYNQKLRQTLVDDFLSVTKRILNT